MTTVSEGLINYLKIFGLYPKGNGKSLGDMNGHAMCRVEYSDVSKALAQC